MKVKEIKDVIDNYIQTDIQYSHPDYWSDDNYNQFVNFISKQRVSERTIREFMVDANEMNEMYGDWDIYVMACEIYDRVMWDRISKHNERCCDISKTICYPDSASICPTIIN